MQDRNAEQRKYNPNGFDPKKVYDRDEFVAVSQSIKDQYPGMEIIQEICERHINWARGHPADTTIHWEKSPDTGMVHPVASTPVHKG